MTWSPSGRMAVTVLRLEVETGHLGELDLDVALAAKDVADGRSDLSLGENAGRDLVEEGLEQVVIAPIHEGHVDRGAPQEACGKEPAEAASDDDNPVRAWCAVGV